MHASQLTHPRLQPLYRLDGGADAPPSGPCRWTATAGSRPVRAGNAAAAQLQLDTYGELLQTAWLYADAGNRVDADIGRRLAEIADLVCRLWRRPDAGIWEVRSEPAHFTQSKMMCWVALDRAQPAGRARPGSRHVTSAMGASRPTRSGSSSSESCYSRAAAELRALRRAPTSWTRACCLACFPATARRGRHAGRSTVDAVRRELGHGPYVRRYTGEDGLAGGEGAFVSCSFWLAEALARTGRIEDARC